MNELNLTNGFKLQRFSPLYSYFAYLDAPSYHADNLFIKHKVTIKFLREFVHDDWPYVLIFGRCRKKDFPKAVAALNELPNKMLICGYNDYQDFCEKLVADMEKGKTALRRKESASNGTNCTP